MAQVTGPGLKMLDFGRIHIKAEDLERRLMQGLYKREPDVAQADDPADGSTVLQLRLECIEVASVAGGIGDDFAQNGLERPG